MTHKTAHTGTSCDSAEQALGDAEGGTAGLEPRLKRMFVGGAMKALVFFAAQAAILFLLAGRWNWGGAWAFLIAMLVGGTASLWIMLRHDPSLIEERVAAFKKGGTWDKPLVVVIAVVCPVLMCVVAGLDERFGWSPRPGLPLQCLAFAVTVTAYGIIL